MDAYSIFLTQLSCYIFRKNFAALLWLYYSLQFQIRGQNLTYIDNISQDSSVCIVTGQTRQPCGLGSLPDRGKKFFFLLQISTPALATIWPLTQSVLWALLLGTEWPQLEADHSLSFSVERKNVWIYTSSFMYLCVQKHGKNFVFTLPTIVNKVIK